MLLRRITEHVKAQNWFAVGLDFLIVVIGVFVGLQVSNWNDARLLKDRTIKVVERLETSFGIDVWVVLNLHRYHQQVYENALLVLNDITGREPISDEELLISAYRATQFNRFNRTSIYEELLSTGGLELVMATDVGAVASIFYETTMLSDYEKYGQASEYRHLYRSIMPIDVQLAASSTCGDRILTVDQTMNVEGQIGYDCALDLAPERMQEAAQALRQHPTVASVLRHRVATLRAQNSDFGTFVEAMRPYSATREELEESPQFKIWKSE
ncbi:MAG: hypothetical protein GXP04_15435 [Alphaproteobacteria bacterium]|nr:hypothetical protein [Alphaproteobacteria bacterium]